MKKVTLLTNVIFIVLIFGACTKSEELNSLNTKDSSQIIISQRTAGPENKMPDLDAGENDPACKDGNTYCVEVLLPTPDLAADFVNAIENGDEKDFLSDIDKLLEIAQGFEYYKDLLIDVRDGRTNVMAYKFPSQDRAIVLYGGSGLSLTNYEAAEALSL